MDGNLSTNARRKRKSIVSTNISNMMMNSSGKINFLRYSFVVKTFFSLYRFL